MIAKIKDIEYHLPKKVVSNEELHRENPKWDMKKVEENAGVLKRHIAGKDETALDIAVQACNKLFSKADNDIKEIDALIFCTQSPDYIMPPNSTILHKILGLDEKVSCFDINLACSGYVYGLMLCQSMVKSQMKKNILFVTADTYSKYINKKDRSSRVLFGDGAAATLVCASSSNEGIIDVECSTSGEGFKKFIIPAGGNRIPKSKETGFLKEDKSGNIRSLEEIHMDGFGILTFVNSKIPGDVRKIIEKNRLKIDAIDLFVFHQASKLVLDSLTKLLKIDDEKVYNNLHRVGNTVSSSIPIALKDAIGEKRISKGSKVLISGFGVGLSWGSAIIQF